MNSERTQSYIHIHTRVCMCTHTHTHTQAPLVALWYETCLQCRRCMRHWFDPWVGKIPWRRAWQPTPVFLPGESHGQRSLAGYSPQGHKELNITEATGHACTHIYIISQTPLPSRLPHGIEQSSMCYTVGPCWLSILHKAVCTWPFKTP